MFTRFLSGTPLSEVEIEMQLIPGFTPRACGTYRSQQRDVDAEAIPYKELLELFLKEVELQAFVLRVRKIIKAANGLQESEAGKMLFKSTEHHGVAGCRPPLRTD